MCQKGNLKSTGAPNAGASGASLRRGRAQRKAQKRAPALKLPGVVEKNMDVFDLFVDGLTNEVGQRLLAEIPNWNALPDWAETLDTTVKIGALNKPANKQGLVSGLSGLANSVVELARQYGGEDAAGAEAFARVVVQRVHKALDLYAKTQSDSVSAALDVAANKAKMEKPVLSDLVHRAAIETGWIVSQIAGPVEAVNTGMVVTGNELSAPEVDTSYVYPDLRTTERSLNAILSIANDGGDVSGRLATLRGKYNVESDADLLGLILRSHSSLNGLVTALAEQLASLDVVEAGPNLEAHKPALKEVKVAFLNEDYRSAFLLLKELRSALNCSSDDEVLTKMNSVAPSTVALIRAKLDED